MSAPLQVIPTDTGVTVRPTTVSLEELAERIRDWEAAQARLQALWDNRTGSGPDLAEAENVARSAADDALELLEVKVSPAEARDVSDLLFTASLTVGHASWKAVL